MVRQPQLKATQSGEDTLVSSFGTSEAVDIQVHLYRILADSANFIYACPLCLEGHSRYDLLYTHFKRTCEREHEELKSLLFGGYCPLCQEENAQVLRHMITAHDDQYHPFMKSILRLRPDVDVRVPAPPQCFEHKFFFPWRRSDRVVQLHRRKRKTANAASKPENGDHCTPIDAAQMTDDSLTPELQSMAGQSYYMTPAPNTALLDPAEIFANQISPLQEDPWLLRSANPAENLSLSAAYNGYDQTAIDLSHRGQLMQMNEEYNVAASSNVWWSTERHPTFPEHDPSGESGQVM